MNDVTTPDNTEEVPSTTPDNTDAPEGAEKPVDNTANNEETVQAGRSDRLALKEMGKYTMNGDTPDYDAIAKVYRGNAISTKALQMFCDQNDLQIDEVKSQLQAQSVEDEDLKSQVARLQAKDTLNSQLEARGIERSEFKKYEDSYNAELVELSGLPQDKKISVALDLALKNRPTTKIAQPEGKTPKPKDGTWSRDKYSNFMNNRSKEVGNDQAVAEFDAYEKKQKEAGKPLYY